jgi:hypothetical protein
MDLRYHADLDGNLLVADDPYHGMRMEDGRLIRATASRLEITETR